MWNSAFSAWARKLQKMGNIAEFHFNLVLNITNVKILEVRTLQRFKDNLYEVCLETMTCGSWSDSLSPIFHGPVILRYILKTAWCMNIILWDYESVWPDIWPTNKCRSLWPIYHGPVILPHSLKTIWYKNTILWDYESVWPPMYDLKKCRSLWSGFKGPVILPYSGWTSYFGIMSQYDPTSDLKIYVDLYLWPIIHGQRNLPYILKSKKISNDQELIQPDPTSCPQNQKRNN